MSATPKNYSTSMASSRFSSSVGLGSGYIAASSDDLNICKHIETTEEVEVTVLTTPPVGVANQESLFVQKYKHLLRPMMNKCNEGMPHSNRRMVKSVAGDWDLNRGNSGLSPDYEDVRKFKRRASSFRVVPTISITHTYYEEGEYRNGSRDRILQTTKPEQDTIPIYAIPNKPRKQDLNQENLIVEDDVYESLSARQYSNSELNQTQEDMIFPEVQPTHPRDEYMIIHMSNRQQDTNYTDDEDAKSRQTDTGSASQCSTVGKYSHFAVNLENKMESSWDELAMYDTGVVSMGESGTNDYDDTSETSDSDQFHTSYFSNTKSAPF